MSRLKNNRNGHFLSLRFFKQPFFQFIAVRKDFCSLAKTGDTETLKRVLGQVLTTPEGRALADKIQKAMGHE